MLEQPLDQQLLGSAQVPTSKKAGTHTPPPLTHGGVRLQAKRPLLGTDMTAMSRVHSGMTRRVCTSAASSTTS